MEMNIFPKQSAINRRYTTDYVKITIWGLALSALWGSLHSIILPMRLLDFVSEANKNTSLAMLTLTGLILAMIIQPIAGAISDRSGFRWGKRRPFLIIGTLVALVLLPGVGTVTSYAGIFAIYCLLQISSNIAQGPYQAFIPDLIPEDRRGIASGVKSLFEIIGGFGLTYAIVFIGNRFTGGGSDWLWMVLGIIGALLLVTMVITIVTVKEKPAAMVKLHIREPLKNSFKINLRQNPDFLVFLVSRLLFVMALTTMQSFSFYFVQDVVGASNPTRATTELLGVVGVGLLLAVWPAGYISDKIGRKPVLFTSGFVGAVGIAILFITTNYSLVLTGGALIGIAGGIFMSSNWALATDLVPKNEEARYLGLANMATAGGAALARFIGPVIDYFNRSSFGLGYEVMLGACFIYFVLAALLILKIKGRRLPTTE